MTPHRTRRLAAVSMGTLGIALVAGGVLPPAASAEICTVTDQDAVCGPGDPLGDRLPPDVPQDENTAGTAQTPGADADRVSAAAVPGADDAIVAQRDEQGDDDYTLYGFARSSDGPSGSSVAADKVGDSSQYTISVANAPGNGDPVDTDSETDVSRASVSADGVRAASGSAASGSSSARSDARGQDATAVSAALDHSRASAHSRGTGASSSAGAGKHSTAFSRAIGRGSHARAVAFDHDRAYALAFLGGSADASPSGTRCRGGVTFAFEQRNPALCTSAGPLSVGLSSASGPAIGLAGITPATPAAHQGRHRA